MTADTVPRPPADTSWVSTTDISEAGLWMTTESINAGRPPVAPRPPDVTGFITTEDPTAAVIDWRGIAILVLTALPVVVAYTVGLIERCVRILVAAVVEAYLAGRGVDRG